MSDWKKNKFWRKTLPKSNIMLMRDHNWAFAAWEISLLNGIIKPGATLVHVDSHLDDVIELAGNERFYKPIHKKEEAICLATPVKISDYDEDIEEEMRYGMRIDNFIWPAIMRGTIDNLIHVSDDSQPEISIETIIKQSEESIRFDREDNVNEYILTSVFERIKHKNKSVRYNSIEDFIGNLSEDVHTDENLILDLDLDYFNDSDFIGEPLLKSDDVIKRNLIDLKDCHNWDLITVALSPEYCGNYDSCKHIFNIFCEVFNVEKESLVDW